MTKKIIVKINRQGMDTGHWYSTGGTFEVSEGNQMWIVLNEGSINHGRGIFKEHCDIVPDEPRLYEHEGVQYVLPDWAKFVTRDYVNANLFAWEEKPEMSGHMGFMSQGGQRTMLFQYIKPLPAGAFIKEL